MLQIDFNGRFAYEKTYATLNNDRINQALTCDVEFVFIESHRSLMRPCHARVLSNSFAYLKTLFRSYATVENNSSPQRPLLVLEQVFTNVQVFEVLAQMAYTGKLCLSKSNAYDLFHDCLVLGFTYASNVWSLIFRKNYHETRVLDFFFLFERNHPNDKPRGWNNTIRYVAQHMMRRSLHQQLLALPIQKFAPLIRHLSRFVNDDDRMLELIVRWGQREPTARKEHIPHLLSNVHLIKISGAFAKDLAAQLFHSKRRYTSRTRAAVAASAETRTLKAFVHMRNERRLYHILEYELSRNGEWCYAGVKLVGGRRHSASKFVQVGEYLFNMSVRVDGTTNDRPYLNKFSRAPLTEYWNLLAVESDDVRESRTAQLKMPIHAVQLCAIDANVYAYRSESESSDRNRIERYNCERNEWRRLVADERHPLTAGSMMVAHDRLLYVLGGRPVENETYSQATFYDRRANKWNRVARMRQTHECGAACVHDGKIYVAGGRNCVGGKLKMVERYDPVAGKWEQVSSLMVERDHFTLVPHNRRLWAVGNRHSLSVEIYDPRNDCWSAYERSMVRARGDRLFVDLWPPEYRYADDDDQLPAFVMDAIVFTL